MRAPSLVLQAAALLVGIGMASAARSQEPPHKQLPDAPAPKPQSSPQKHQNPFNATMEVLERPSIFFPEIATRRGPLTKKQKLELSAGESIAPSRLLRSAAGAGISQARNTHAAYGQGADGYGERFAASIATSASSDFFGTFLIASLLHRDPRYFVILHGGPGRRIGYALSRIVVGRTDEGKSAANWGGMLGPLLAESLANSYLPVKEQTAGQTFQRYGVRVGFNAAGNILREYWPNIFRGLRITKIAPGLKTEPTPAPAPPPASTPPPSD